MFSEPTINSISNLYSVPGLELELLGASLLAFGVVCYLARIAWIALSHARQMELAAMQTAAMQAAAAQTIALADGSYSGPYCAG